MPSCKSVIVFACRFPVGTMLRVSHAPYTQVGNTITPKMDTIALEFRTEMERRGIVCAPLPTNEARYDANTGRSRAIVSLKDPICTNCGLCVSACPIHALEKTEMDRQACWEYAFGTDQTLQTWQISCHKCRDVCPYNLESQRGSLCELLRREGPAL